jgi:endonuclease G
MSANSPRLLARLVVLALLLVALAALPARAQQLSVHLALGNPSGAVTDINQPDNYLIARPEYALAYSRDRGTPRWVSWHLEAADLGGVDRYEGKFFTDTSLPDGWYRVTHDDYTSTGFDRGHMTPSADRTASEQANEATFLMTNIVPQAPDNNRGPWAVLEEYTRDLVRAGNEAYIVAGPVGAKGTIAGARVTVPAAVWKVIVVLPAGDDDLARVTADTPVIAVLLPNDATVKGRPWDTFRTTVRCIQERTGFDLLSAVAPAVQTALEGAGCTGTAPVSIYLPLVRAASQTQPAPSPTASPAPAPSPTPSPTPAPSAGVQIVRVEYDPPGDDLAGEYVLIANQGQAAADLAGWTLRDESGTVYSFPAFTLAPGAEVRVWVKAGTNDAANLYWGRGSPVWNNAGDTATLRDARGELVSVFTYE